MPSNIPTTFFGWVRFLIDKYGDMFLRGTGVTLLVALTVIAIALSVSLRSAAKGKISQSEMILRGTERPEDGYVANEDMKVFLGRTGTVITTLRPTGMAEFDGVRLNVMSSGEFIEAGTQVLIEKVDGSRILVRALTAKA